MKKSFKVISVVTAASLVFGGLSLVGAQNASSFDDVLSQGVRQEGQRFPNAQRGARGMMQRGNHAAPMMERGGLAFFGARTEGTSIRVDIYDVHPEEGGTVVETLSHVVGESSERVFQDEVQEALSSAAYADIMIGETVRTLTIPEQDADTMRPRGLSVPLRGLNEGSGLSVSFYSGHPDEGGVLVETIDFVQGETSEVAFSNDLVALAADASHAVITTSPQSRSIDLTAMQERITERGVGKRLSGRSFFR